MPFYEFDQNNTGGSFTVDENLCQRLYIEADTAEEANKKAKKLGVYFNGCEDGMDCECCGDRWYPVSTPVPLEKFKTEGYRAGTYQRTSFHDTAENRWKEKYGSYQVVEKPRWNASHGIKEYEGRIAFANIAEYANYLANDFTAWTKPHSRIFYKDDSVTEIYGKERGK